jgi:putative sigma-54 modulation protein
MSRKSKAAEFVDEEYSLTINGRNVQVTDAMKNYVMEKLSKLDKFGTRIIDVAVTMDVQKFQHQCDIVVKLNQIKIKSSAISEDMYISIDRAVDKVQAQLRKYKQRIQDHHAKPLEEVDMTVNVVRPALEGVIAEINDDIEAENWRKLDEEYRPHQIVKKEKMPLKVLNWDEAIMKMELSGDPFLVFRNEADGKKINVIYRRKDGDFGILMPEG